jgi:hypothetical protein
LQKEAESFLSSIALNLPERGIVGVTKPGRENVYSAISSLEAETLANDLLDAESRSQIAVKMQKEAETFFAGISDGLPRELMGLTPEDWFDQDELDRDLTPLIDQQAPETETSFKVALRHRKDPAQQDLGGARRMPNGPFLLRGPAMGWGM